MDDLVDLWETPVDKDNYMIVGWQQWADAGAISSELPRYLIDLVGARKIGEIKKDGFYLFQFPGTHHLLRPHIKLVDGHCQHLSTHQNELYYAERDGKGLLIFAGEEPHMNESRYAEAFFDMAEALQVKRIAAVGGVYGPVPYEKDREVSCAYSLPRMREELEHYAVQFSNYEGGSTIGTYLARAAEQREIEFMVFYGYVPAYDFEEGESPIGSIRIDQDWKAWYELLRRLDYMFGYDLDLTELKKREQTLIEAWDRQIEELTQKHPELGVKEFLAKIRAKFTERPFLPLDSAWDELGDLLDDMDE
jgi:proteasome assembly chaperone (PAC2) family protein